MIGYEISVNKSLIRTSLAFFLAKIQTIWRPNFCRQNIWRALKGFAQASKFTNYPDHYFTPVKPKISLLIFFPLLHTQSAFQRYAFNSVSLAIKLLSQGGFIDNGSRLV